MPIPTSDFWSDDPCENPPLEETVVAKAERHFGRKLPPLYLDLIRLKNGGTNQGFAFPTAFPTSWAEDHVPFEEMAGIAFGDLPMDSIMKTDYMTEEWDLPPDLILLAGDGHTWIALDYRRGEVPQVSWIEVDADEDVVLAETFESFYAGLVPSAQFALDD